MPLSLFRAIALAALAVSHPGLPVAAANKHEVESTAAATNAAGATNAAQLSQTQAATPAATGQPLMAFAFNGGSKEPGGTGGSGSPVVDFGHGPMYLIDFKAAQTNLNDGSFTWDMSSSVGNVNVTAVGLCTLSESGHCDLAVPDTPSDDLLLVAVGKRPCT